MWPTNGSDTVLNTNAVSGPGGIAGAFLLVAALRRRDRTGPRSIGEGNSSTMNVEQPVDPDRLRAPTRRSPARAEPSRSRPSRRGRCPPRGASPPRGTSRSGRRRTRRPPPSASRAPGRPSRAGPRATRDSSAMGPSGSGRPSRAGDRRCPRTRAPAPIGSSNGATWLPKDATSWSRVAWKSARSRSSLFTKIARGRPASTASSQAYSVWTSTPSTAETTTITASAARTARAQVADEVGVARGVEDVDLRVLPLDGRHRRARRRSPRAVRRDRGRRRCCRPRPCPSG